MAVTNQLKGDNKAREEAKNSDLDDYYIHHMSVNTQ